MANIIVYCFVNIIHKECSLSGFGSLTYRVEEKYAIAPYVIKIRTFFEIPFMNSNFDSYQK